MIKYKILELDGCVPLLGCVPRLDFSYISPNLIPKDIANNPFIITPQTPKQIDASFLLFTCENRDKPDIYDYKYELKDGSKAKSKFSADRKTKIIVHGYTDSYYLTKWMKVNITKLSNF